MTGTSLRIAVLVETLGAGGAERAILNIVRALLERGHRCTVIALRAPMTLSTDLTLAGADVRSLDLRHRWDLPRGLGRLLSMLRHERFDVLHAHLFFAGLYAGVVPRSKSIPLKVVTFHNLGYDSYPARGIWRRVRKTIDGWVMRHRIDGYTAPSSAVATHYRSHLRLRHIDVIPNSVSTDALARASKTNGATVRDSFHTPQTAPLIVMPGRLVPEKGHMVLLKALDLLEQGDLRPYVVLAGDGPLRDDIDAVIEQRRDPSNIYRVGYVDHASLLALIAAADVCVSASTHEGFGLAIAEAMALGTPVVATRVGGLTELIEDGVSGVLVPPDDPVALADSLHHLLRDDLRRRELAAVGKRRALQWFAPDEIASRLEHLYLSLAERRNIPLADFRG